MTDIQTQGEDPISMLVERLRGLDEAERSGEPFLSVIGVFREAADALLALQARVKGLETISRLLDDAERMEASETLSSYSRMFAELIASGRRPETANAFAVARATHKYAQQVFGLSQERDRLREALEPFANIPSVPLDDDGWAMAKHLWAVIGTPDRSHFTQTDLMRARAALQKEPS